MYLQPTTTSVNNALNEFQKDSWNYIAELASENPNLARCLGCAKACSEIFTEIGINFVNAAEEFANVCVGEGRMINVLQHVGCILVSPFIAVAKMVAYGALIIYDPQKYSKEWAAAYETEIHAYAMSKADQNDLSAKAITQTLIDGAKVKDCDDPKIQTYIEKLVLRYITNSKHSTPEAKIAAAQTFFLETDSGIELLNASIEKKQNNQPAKDLEIELNRIFADFKEVSGLTDFEKAVIAHEEQFLKESIKNNKPLISKTLEEIRNGEFVDKLKDKFDLKTAKFDKLGAALGSHIESLNVKTQSKFSELATNFACGGDGKYGTNPIKLDGLQFDYNYLINKHHAYVSTLILSNTDDEISAITFEENEPNTIFIENIVNTLEIGDEPFKKDCARIAIRDQLEGFPGSRTGIFAEFSTRSNIHEFISLNDKRAFICQQELAKKLEGVKAELEAKEIRLHFSGFVNEISKKDANEIEEAYQNALSIAFVG